jgi:nucleoside triphosphate diphosphatase
MALRRLGREGRGKPLPYRSAGVAPFCFVGTGRFAKGDALKRAPTIAAVCRGVPRCACQSLWGTVEWNVCCDIGLAGRAMAIKKKKGRRRGKAGAARKVAASSKRLTAGEWFEKLAAVQARLRAPDGCPWDREQTHASLRTYLIEEAYEVLEAMESGDDAKFAEEMGDLLLQIVFHSEIAREEGRFDVSDVIREVHDKMVRRHPHVFGEKRAKDSAEVLKNWEQLKKEERIAAGKKNADGPKGGAKTASLLDGVSRALPAALEGFQLTRRAARIGFDWDSVEGVFDKMNEEAGELREAVGAKDAARAEEEMGDLLFAAVNLARFLHIDPEIALKKANVKFSTRFRRMEELAAKDGRVLADVPRQEMEELWEEVKKVASGE